jgi:hypothetical protein
MTYAIIFIASIVLAYVFGLLTHNWVVAKIDALKAKIRGWLA